MVYVENEILLSHKKEWNNAICSNMGKLRDDHAQRSKSDKERPVAYGIIYKWNLKTDTPELMYRVKHSHILRKQIYGYHSRKVGGRDELRNWD